MIILNQIFSVKYSRILHTIRIEHIHVFVNTEGQTDIQTYRRIYFLHLPDKTTLHCNAYRLLCV